MKAESAIKLPPMTRKRKLPVQQKRQQVTDSSGWTHIVKGPKSDMATISQLPSQRLETSLTVEVYASKFRMMYSPQWQESPCLQSLRRLFEHDILPAENITLSNCVCLGLGSLTVGTPTSSYELVALTSMLEMMSMYSYIYSRFSDTSSHKSLTLDAKHRHETQYPRGSLPRSCLQCSGQELPSEPGLHRPR